MKIVFWINPLEDLSRDKDTSLAFMQEAWDRGHEVFILGDNGIHLKPNTAVLSVSSLEKETDLPYSFVEGDSHSLNAKDVDVIFIRKDPPFDDRYLMQTWLLDRLSPHVFVTSNPTGIRTVNEKIWVTQFEEWVPETLVTSSFSIFLDFLLKVKKVVVKPTDGFGGQGIHVLSKGDSHTQMVFEKLSESQEKPVIVQAFVAEASEGDKRVLVLNGDPLGAVLRKQEGEGHLHNLMAGGTALAVEITEKELAMIACLSPHLKSLGLHFVGLDFIGEKLIEVNVTSPTCLREMNALYGTCLEMKVLDFVETSVIARRNEVTMRQSSN